MYFVVVISKLISLYSILILINVLGSWMDPRREMAIFNMVRKVTDPFLQIFRIVVPIKNIGLDISPVIALAVLRLINDIVFRIFGTLFY